MQKGQNIHFTPGWKFPVFSLTGRYVYLKKKKKKKKKEKKKERKKERKKKNSPRSEFHLVSV